MIIEDPESFKIWLTARLEPLCDADPAALAKYVYALVKKDKPVDDLKASMIDQLEVFLQKETHGFVDLLFRTLETQVYDMTPEPPPVVVPSPVGSTIPKGAVTDVDLRETLPTSTDELERKISVKEIEKDERSRRGRRRGSSASLERRPRSRSRSYERRRSRSRERDRARAWRNKSPPPRRYERRRSYSKSPVRRHSRSRTPSNKRGRYRNRSPPRSRSRTRSRTRTRSRSPLDRDRKEIGPNSPPRDSVAHGDTDLRLSNVSQSIQSVVAVPPEIQNYPARRCRDFDEKGYCMRGDLCPFDHGTDPVILEDVGVMYNGSAQQPAPLAPQPHAGHHNVEQLHHPTPPIRPPPPITTNLTEYNPDAPSMEPRMWGRPFRSGPMIRGMVRGGVMGRGGFGPHHQRELINVVTGGGPPYRHPRPHINSNIDPGDQMRMDGGKRGGFDFNRLGNNRMSRNMNPPGNSSLQLKKVPPGVNNITHLNNHFSKFGKILNIQVGFEGDPESALITFSTHTEANVAYKSTEAVLNNRFIRVYWYNPNNNNSANNSNNNNNNNNNNISNESKQENMPPPPRPSVLERLGAPPSKVLNNLQPSAVIQQEEKVTLVNNNLSKTLYIPSAMNREITPEKKAQIAAEVLKKKEEEDSIKEKKVKQEEARKESIKLNADLRKRKQELLEKQLNQQKLLIQRLETGIHTPEQKAKVMTTIKTLQDSIEKLRKDLATTVKATITKTKGILTKEHLELVKKTREETQRKLLDAELDLYNRQQEGKDTIELKKKVSELKMKAFSLGLSTVTKGATTARGRGSFRARGRGRGSRFTFSGSYDHNVVDHRPTKLLVSGYEQDDKADVLAHFAQYGEIADYVTDDATPSLILNFKSRKEAEVAIAKGRNFQDRLLSVTWASHSHSLRSGVPSKNHRSVMVVDEGVDEVLEGEDEEEIVSLLSPTALLQDEEDEEEEDRSWRR